MSAALRKQVAEKKAKLKELQETHKRTEDLVFRLLNQPSPYMVDLNKLASARKEISKLRHILAVRNRSQLIPAFNELADRRQREIDRRQKQVDELEAEKAELEKRLAELKANDPGDASDHLASVKLVLSDFSTGVGELRAELLRMRKQIEDRLNDTKQQIRDVLQRTYDEAMKRLKEEDDKIKALQKKKAELEGEKHELEVSGAELAEAKAGIRKPVTIDEDPAVVKKQREQMIQRVREILRQSQQRLLQVSFEKQFVLNLNAKIGGLLAAIDRVIGKVRSVTHLLSTRDDFERRKVALRRNLRARSILALLFRLARRAMFVETVLSNMAPKLRELNLDIAKQIAYDKEFGTKVIPEVGMTIGDLRKEIVRLEREIYKVNFEGEREIEENEKQRKRFTELAQKELERLEKVNG